MEPTLASAANQMRRQSSTILREIVAGIPDLLLSSSTIKNTVPSCTVKLLVSFTFLQDVPAIDNLERTEEQLSQFLLVSTVKHFKTIH